MNNEHMALELVKIWAELTSKQDEKLKDTTGIDVVTAYKAYLNELNGVSADESTIESLQYEIQRKNRMIGKIKDLMQEDNNNFVLKDKLEKVFKEVDLYE